jgi:hypothetical protein
MVVNAHPPKPQNGMLLAVHARAPDNWPFALLCTNPLADCCMYMAVPTRLLSLPRYSEEISTCIGQPATSVDTAAKTNRQNRLAPGWVHDAHLQHHILLSLRSCQAPIFLDSMQWFAVPVDQNGVRPCAQTEVSALPVHRCCMCRLLLDCCGQCGHARTSPTACCIGPLCVLHAILRV